jgi:DNA mismatch endonuclease (patch repair protein)
VTETPEARSRIMRAVKGRDTKPEIAVRRLAHRLGYRFRLHRPDLPGRPDLAFPGRKAAIYVNGCFWHGHACKRGARVPKANRSYWTAKIARNMERDRVSLRRLRSLGWRGLVIWECAIKDEARLAAKIRRFLDQGT